MQQDHSEVKEIKFSNAELLPEVVRLMDEGHTVTINLRGFSMRPFLENDRDKALLTKAKEIHKGDVVLAETAPKHYVLHRIINIDGDHITLRGDGNLLEEHCRREDVKGFAIGFYRKGRKTIDKTNSFKWLLYSRLWTSLYPIRRYLLAAYRHIWLRFFKPI
ncbi:S24/S26 family peptidase [Hoylesella enoeca]|uniref:Peptidase S41 n=1 Tax=Hoylesella enoeca TaxID=76123 RepID=A0A0S2KI99_9BACT|nr:S24/S26 family peptidase [Hoylesella enoeca]ALO48044.1 peptidase S41 [Hoylesella enoeca]